MRRGLTYGAAFVATVWAANYAVRTWGIVPVGFGLSAPAGVYFAGLAFTLRDRLHDVAGIPAVAVAILLGAALSWRLGGSLAVASAVAFLASETADLAVYAPLRRRGWLGALVASNVVGLVVDSWLFLTLAFGSTAFLAGQCVGKAWVTLASIPLVAALRRRAATT